MDSQLISVENLSLWYPHSGRKVSMRSKRGRNKDLLCALKEVSFHLSRGECLGIAGVNGSGKSSLLKCIAGILKPQEGKFEVKGTLFPMIMPGNICQPLLTGRETISYIAAWIGFSPPNWGEFIEEIIEFSELAEDIDKIWAHYSSGMRARLLFAFALARKPDVLLLDEVLAVGDAAFRIKCYNALSRQKKSGGIILVSHNPSLLAYACDRVLWLDKGVVRAIGKPETVLDAYLQESMPANNKFESLHRVHPPVVSAKLEALHPEEEQATVTLNFSIETAEALEKTWLRVLIYHGNGSLIAEADLRTSIGLIDWPQGRHSRRISLPNLSLQPGQYQLGLQITQADGLGHYVWILGVPFTIVGEQKGHGHWRLDASIE